jgi:uncharacterized lipoprotein YajG
MQKRLFSSLVLVGVIGLAGCAKTPTSATPAPCSTLVSVQVDGGDTAALSQANQAPQNALKLLQ